MSDNSVETDFLIVGGGIAGPAMAAALARYDYRVVLLEKSPDPIDTARGDHLQPFTIEILQRWGVYEHLLSLGAEKRRGAVWLDAQGNELLNSSMSELDIPFPYFLFLNHEKISQCLLEVAERNQNFSFVRPIRNWWREDDNKIRVVDGQGQEQFITAKVVVGADGRNSRVRKVWGIEYDAHAYEKPIAVMFGKHHEENTQRNLKIYLGQSIVPVIPRTGGGCKVGVPISKEAISEWKSSDANELNRRLVELVPCLKLSDLEFADVYPPVYLNAKQWTKDNAVLIGDACHAMHPARSQGMNITIRCVDGLVALIQDNDPGLGDVSETLAAYDAKYRPPVRQMLEENHKKGLEFENLDGDALAGFARSLAGIQQNDAARLAYGKDAAGYAV
ncbi:MAG: NAD(P)/FAD-dependent oxidoreductase [Pseudomonadota bacterium]